MMEEVLNTGLQFWQLLVLMVGLVVSVVAIKIAISFDVNKFLERKDQQLNRKIRNTCPHVTIQQVDSEKFSIQSLFESPSGTLQWQCQKCGLIRNHNNDCEKECQYWGSHIDEYSDRMKKFQRLLKKGGAL